MLCNTNLSPPVVQTVKLTTCGYLLNVLNICETRKDFWDALFSGQSKITRDQVGVSLNHQTYCIKLARVYQIVLDPVVQKLDSAIHRINLYPMDNAIGFPNTYPLDSDLSVG